MGSKNGKKESNRFNRISDVEKLKSYLKSADRIKKNEKYIHLYTNIERVTEMFSSGKIWLANATDMNDEIEYKAFPEAEWEGLFFKCFMAEESESIAMWSMYAIPPEAGVKISIRVKEFKKWIRALKKGEYSIEANRNDEWKSIDYENVEIGHLAVAYCDNLNIVDQKGTTIRWSTVKNTNFSRVNVRDSLIGCIKDDAWAYEKELRLILRITSEEKYQSFRVGISEELMKSAIVTSGPCYSDRVAMENFRNANREVEITKSKYIENAKKIFICERCQYSFNYNGYD
ncbi:MAG: DUF2971 domain-containing protein [Clostridiales Family XIII bacterium]|jgi:hypothetical protein|nr:DUF2971 domain-containing protein [Clostridiales Family XIII bacterium]